LMRNCREPLAASGIAWPLTLPRHVRCFLHQDP
jgi:hypothetical protein